MNAERPKPRENTQEPGTGPPGADNSTRSPPEAGHSPAGQQECPAGAEQTERRRRTELIERLFREHNEALIRFLMARLHSYQDARDVAQEAYVRLLSLDEPGAVSYLRAFLFKTAANLAIDRQRREATHERASELPLFREFADVRTPERRAVGRETIERLERLIAAMPAKCRQAFILYEFDGLGFAAIAEHMRISERMVRKYVVRALLQCRTELDLEGSAMAHRAGASDSSEEAALQQNEGRDQE